MAMQQQDVVSDVITHKALITACKEQERALEVFAAMQQRDGVLNVFVYNALISACDRWTSVQQVVGSFAAAKCEAGCRIVCRSLPMDCQV